MKFFSSGIAFSFIVLISELQKCSAFYLQYVALFTSLKFHRFSGISFPALYSVSYDEGYPVLVFEKRITGEIIPFISDYGFCERPYPPIGWLEMVTLGETISAYDISFAENVTCKHLCTKTFVGGDAKDKERLDALRKGISLNLKQHWMMDYDIPGLWCPELDNGTEIGILNGSYCESGFPIGCYTRYGMEDLCYKNFNQFGNDEKYFIFNHIDFIMVYEGSPVYPFRSRLVNVKVVPSSINHSDSTDCSRKNPLELPKGDVPLRQSFDIKYTYSYKFIRNDDMKWSSRWDYIFRSLSFSDLHWIPLVYSILALLSVVLVPITVIAGVYRDSRSYKMMECGDSVEPKLRWRLITHGYAHPAVRVCLSLLLGSVFQLVSMAVAAIGFSLLAYLVSDGRDSQMLWALGIFIILGSVGGYCAALFYKGFGGDQWKTNILIPTIICPGIAVSVFFMLDCMLFFIDSSASLPIYTLSGFMGTTYLLIVPFTALGYVLGFRSWGSFKK